VSFPPVPASAKLPRPAGTPSAGDVPEVSQVSPLELEWAPNGGGGGSGTVTSVTAADPSIVVSGTGTVAPELATGTLDVIASEHPPAASWSNNSKKITSVANGSGAQDAAAFGQTLGGGDLAPLTTEGDMLYANATPAPARLPIGTAPQVLGISAGVPAWVSQNYAGVFGDGSDGAVTLDGSTSNGFSSLAGSTYTMTRDCFCTSLTINGGVTLKPAGYRIFVAGTLANAGTISSNGNNATGASAGGATGNGIVNGGGAGTNGVTGNAAAPTALGLILGAGSGGNGGNGGTGTGGTGTAHKLATAYPYRVTGPVLSAFMTFNNSTGIPSGGGAGAGGGGDGTNAGGGGGSGGGFIVILAWAVTNTGTITASGGNGANGVAGNAGGGGGGGGGLILAYTLAAWTAGTTSVAAGSLGTGTGTGANGTGGGAGTVLNVVLQ
jgi:hypothetical protein